MSARAESARGGMTLIEVILAVTILGICTLGLMSGLGRSSETFLAAQFVRGANNVAARGDAEHPAIVKNDPVEDLEVSADADLLEGWTYERACEEDEDEDGLYVVRTKVVKKPGGEGLELEFVTLLYCDGVTKAGTTE